MRLDAQQRGFTNQNEFTIVAQTATLFGSAMNSIECMEFHDADL